MVSLDKVCLFQVQADLEVTELLKNFFFDRYHSKRFSPYISRPFWWRKWVLTCLIEVA